MNISECNLLSLHSLILLNDCIFIKSKDKELTQKLYQKLFKISDPIEAKVVACNLTMAYSPVYPDCRIPAFELVLDNGRRRVVNLPDYLNFVDELYNDSDQTLDQAVEELLDLIYD